jgi:hypothetical protein
MKMVSIDRILEIGFPEAMIIINDDDIMNYYNPYQDRNYYSYIIIIENRKYILKVIEIKRCLGMKNSVISSLKMPNNEMIYRVNKNSMIKLLFEKLK